MELVIKRRFSARFSGANDFSFPFSDYFYEFTEFFLLNFKLIYSDMHET